MDGGSTEGVGGGPFIGPGGSKRWRAHSEMAIWSLLIIGSMLLNATLLIAFIRKPGLRTISNRFVMNLIGSNLLTCTVLTALLISGGTGGSYSPASCALSEGVTALVTTSSIFSVLLIGRDQYLAVVDPLRYRTRIDKLKCAVLILAVWFLALLFGILGGLAGLSPRTDCQEAFLNFANIDAARRQSDNRKLSIAASVLMGSGLAQTNATGGFQLSLSGFLGNSESAEVPSPPNYGLVYALGYALLGYLAPFLGVCWIYISIYAAARRNSERTRRSGSRPVLSSSVSLNDDARAISFEDFRRIPKISSLSSIAESTETTTPAGQQIFRGPGEVENESAPPVVFTLGSSRMSVPLQPSKDECKAKFLQAERQVDDSSPTYCAKHCFSKPDEQRTKSSQDLANDAKALSQQEHLKEESSDEDEEELEEVQPLSLRQEILSKSQARDTSHRPDDIKLEIGDEVTDGVPPKLSSPPPIVTITPPGQKVPSTKSVSSKSSGSYISNIKHRFSNGSLFRYREETRAARISALVIVMGLICWTPYVVTLVMKNLPNHVVQTEVKPRPFDATALGFLILGTYLSPLLFGYRSKRVKRELRKFFCFKRELSYKNNRSLMAKKVLRRRHSGGILGQLENDTRYNIFNCVYGRNRWPKEKVHFVQVPETALAVETCRSSFSSGASTQISSTSTDEC